MKDQWSDRGCPEECSMKVCHLHICMPSIQVNCWYNFVMETELRSGFFRSNEIEVSKILAILLIYRSLRFQCYHIHYEERKNHT